MSARARDAILAAEAVVGYEPYLKLIPELLAGKTVIGTGMTQEIDRCQAALEEALTGKTVAVVSSGDPGIYGMAGLVLEIVQRYPAPVQPEVEIIPGISAMGAAAALLGAPLMHDFAVISLSDLLTPWEVIEKRVEMTAADDFIVALYNPKSTRRVKQIEKVREIMLEYRPSTTPVGIVRQASRSGERMILSDLYGFTGQPIDMFSLVIIGKDRKSVV